MAMKWVLVIDDDPAMVALLTDRLESAGCFVTSATDALQGLIQAETLSPVLVILDLVMPSFGGGVDVLKRIRKNPRLKNVPVIVLTGMPAEKARSLLPRNDAKLRLLHKPPDWPLVLKTIQEMLQVAQKT
ncbi:MAG: response regulator [Elusimicrobiota bacterium]